MPYTLREARRRWLTVIVLQLAIGFAVFLLAGQQSSDVKREARALAARVSLASQVRSEQKLAELRAVCERGNVQRAWNILTAADHARARRLFPLLDCYTTIYRADGHAVALVPSERERYLAAVARGRAPVVNSAGAVLP